MASSCLLPGCSAVGCQFSPTTCFRELSSQQFASAALQGSRGLDSVVHASKGSALCHSIQCNVVSPKATRATRRLATSSSFYGNGGLQREAGRQRFAFRMADDEKVVDSQHVRPAVRAEQEAAPEEKPKRRRAAPRAKKAEPPSDTGGVAETEAKPTPKRTTTRRRTTKAKADADSAGTDSEDGEPASTPRRTRTPRKKAAAQEEAGPSAFDLKEEEAPGVGQAAAGKVRRRRKSTGSKKEADGEARIGAESGSDEEHSSDEEGPENGASENGAGNGMASRKNDGEVGGGRQRQVVVGELVSVKERSENGGRRNSVTAEPLPEDEELRVIAQKIVDGRARDMKLRPELDKLLDHYYLQECTKCYKVFVGRRPAPEQPYYGICRRPSDGNRWRSEVHEVVDSHVPSAITQPYPITHKLGKQTRYRYRVPAILAVCQMAGAIFPPTDNEFFDVIRRHDSRYEPFHIGALDLDQPPPPGGWRLEDAELLAEDTREKKLRMLRMRGHEFQDTYMPDDTGMTAETFADRSIPVASQGDYNATSRRKDKYRP